MLQKQLTSRQITEWMAYDRLEPIGEWRADFRVAQLCAVIKNLVLSLCCKKGTYELAAPIDFMPDWAQEIKKEAEPQSVEEMKQMLFAFGVKKGKRKKSKK